LTLLASLFQALFVSDCLLSDWAEPNTACRPA
jgi:hypothetical protein